MMRLLAAGSALLLLSACFHSLDRTRPGDGPRPGDLPSVSDRVGTELPLVDRALTDRARYVCEDASGLCWNRVEAGRFWMGSPISELCREPALMQESLHEVNLTHAFRIMTTEVSLDSYKVMGYDPTGGVTPYNCIGCPAGQVSWHEAAAFCDRLSTDSGLTPCYSCTGAQASVTCNEAAGYTGTGIYGCPGYRLPTEAEWEKAYRAGRSTALYNGEITDCGADPNASQIGWYTADGARPRPTGLKDKNELGLYDMAGNMFEWVHDWRQADLAPASDLGVKLVQDPVGIKDEAKRVLRGGSFNHSAGYLRAAMRYSDLPDARKRPFGFRCAQSVP
jgi:formylglycine-generating enzyme